MNTYQRMLVHRISAYFCLEHNVDAATKQCVIVHKKERSRVPALSFHKLIPEAVGGAGEGAQGGTGAAATDPDIKRQILKREQSDTNDTGSGGAKGARYPYSDAPVKSFEEKTAEYLRAKNRIFNENASTKKPVPNPSKDAKIAHSHSASNVATNGKAKPVNKSSQFTILNRNQSAPQHTASNGKAKPIKNGPPGAKTQKVPMEPLAKSQSYAASGGYPKHSSAKFVRNTSQTAPQAQAPVPPNFYSPNPMVPAGAAPTQPGADMHELQMRMQHMHMNQYFMAAPPPPTVPVPAPPAPNATGGNFMPNAQNAPNSSANQLFVNTGTVAPTPVPVPPPSYNMYPNANSSQMKSANGTAPHQPFVSYPIVSPGAMYATKQAPQQSLISIQYANQNTQPLKNPPSQKNPQNFGQKQPKKASQPLLNYQPVPTAQAQNTAPQFAQMAPQHNAQFTMVNVYPAHALPGFYANPNAFVAPPANTQQALVQAPAQPFAYAQKMPQGAFYPMHAAPTMHYPPQPFNFPPQNNQPTPQNQPKPLAVNNSNNKFFNHNNNNHVSFNGNNSNNNHYNYNKQTNSGAKPKSFNAQMPQRKYQNNNNNKQPYQNKSASSAGNRVKSVSPPKIEKCEEVVNVEQGEVRSVNIDELLANINAQASHVLQAYDFESGLTKGSFDAQLRSGVDERVCIHYCRYDEDQCCVGRLGAEELSAMLGAGEDLHVLNQIENVFVLLEFSGDKQLNSLMDMMASEQNGNFKFKCKHLTNTTNYN